MKKLLSVLLVVLSLHAHAFVVYGHRGARGLAPENSIPSVDVALENHVDAIDVDVVLTKDGVVVAYHDLTLNPDITRDKYGRWLSRNDIAVKELTFAETQAYDVGRIRPGTAYAAMFKNQKGYDHIAIPELKALIQYVKRHAKYPVGFQIEIKTDPTHPDISASPEDIVPALNQVIIDEGIEDRAKIQAFDWYCLYLMKLLNPAVETAFLSDNDTTTEMLNDDEALAGSWTGGYLLKDYHDSVPEMIQALGGSWWDSEAYQLTNEQVEEAHSYGLKVAAWFCLECTGESDANPELFEKLIEMDVDGIITDRPDVLQSML